ncbi:MAG: TonB-dependent receptor [Acidobacteria bacterium]|nr:TonB-dependent receptor [Acidobacteriota bacterium]
MKIGCRPALVALMAIWLAVPALAGQGAPAQPTPPAAQKPSPADPKKDPPGPDEPQKYEETVVVSASRAEERLVNAPATMTVISGLPLETAPSQNFAELLRSVPGLNITQVSARDINVTSRAATGTLATGQLALLDGRSLYQDFFGFVMWDLMPVNFDEIKQIEVIRGPASAVWGANAMHGVVNVITKTPREMQGTSATLGFGSFDRRVGGSGPGAGGLWFVNGTHAQAIDDRWAYKLSAGGYSQDPMARPTGTIPGSPGTQYPNYTNMGTTQPKFDGRLDYEFEDGRRLSFTGGVAGTEGVMHSGIGPFDIDSGTVMGYGKVSFSRGGFRTAFFTNVFDGSAANLLTQDVTGQRIGFDFATRTVDLEASNLQAMAGRHVLSYGGNLRFNHFEISLAPAADNRTEFGVYLQDDIFLSSVFRLNVGLRMDRFDYLESFVFSPRTSFMIKPQENHTIRLSYNRAYRSPSVINNFLEVTIAEPINLGLFSPLLAGQVYPLPIRSVGNPDLDEELLDAYEVGYTGVLGQRTVFTAALYNNRSRKDILFTEDTTGRWTATNPPPGWPLPPQVISLATGGRGFPGRFTYLNFGRTTQRGLELGVDTSVSRFVSAFVNYSYQAEPRPDGFDLSELNLPAKNRFNAGVNVNYQRFLGNMAVSYSDSAFWQDVLDARYSGTTEAYTLVNGSFGVRWMDNRVTTSLKVVNLGNQEIQQHVFGDIMKRQVVAEMRLSFPR